MQASAQKYLPADKMYIVVVGDRAKAFPGLSELGYDVQELDLNGAPVVAAATPAPAAAPTSTVMPTCPTAKPRRRQDGRKVKTKKKG
ncbi:MAG: hypothetical protein WKG07_31090 [Hymenobacter sp.]